MSEEQYYKTAWNNLKKYIDEAQNRRLTADTRKALEVTVELIKMEEKSIENYKWFFKSFPEIKEKAPYSENHLFCSVCKTTKGLLTTTPEGHICPMCKEQLNSP